MTELNKETIPKFTEFHGEGMMEISDREFILLRDLIYKNFGINLTEAKRSLLVRRLQSWLKNQGFSSFKTYYDHLTTHPNDDSFSELANRITTNYTFFNREPDHFDHFQQVGLPELTQAHQQEGSYDLRVWCAAASTGEEPYMLAMLMMDFLGGRYNTWDAGVLATDISHRALSVAKLGVYTEEQIKTLPTRFRNQYFTKMSNGSWSANDRLKKEITYRRFNLVNQAYPFKKRFDIIFCRNVMIYFDNPTKDHVIQRLSDCLRPGGYLYIGHSESIARGKNGLQYIKPAVYKKVYLL